MPVLSHGEAVKISEKRKKKWNYFPTEFVRINMVTELNFSYLSASFLPERKP
jgi:hypothetical protein